MAATFPTLSFVYETEAGAILQVAAGVTVKAADEAGTLLDSFTTDTDGRVAGASIAGASSGDIVHFRIENYLGMAASVAVRMS